jgi:hypothetical protein
MKFYSLCHLADGTVASFVPAGSARIRKDVAVWIAYLAEFDRRRLFVPEGYSSLYSYCLRKLELSEDEAGKYIRVARAARKFPVIFEALAERRLHLTGIVLLARHLTSENVDDLLAAAAHRTRAGIEQLIAERFPSPDVPSEVRAIETSVCGGSLEPIEMKPTHDLPAPGRVKLSTTEPAASQTSDLVGILIAPALGTSRELLAPERATGQESYARVTPLAPQRYALQVTIGQATHEKLRHAQDLLGPGRASSDIAQVLDRALDELIQRLERTKFAAAARSGSRRSAGDGRYVPSEVRREVWKRDHGRCTFVSDSGQACDERCGVEFDHIEPIARGGQSTVANVRLRCRAHNQFAAERTYGADFMRGKRDASRESRIEAREQAVAETTRLEAARLEAAQAEVTRLEAAEKARAAAKQVRAADEAQAAVERAKSELIPLLRQLGFRSDEARRAAALGAADPTAPLEQRVRLALRHLAPPCTRHIGAPAPAPA